jgi:hypothetical protein
MQGVETNGEPEKPAEVSAKVKRYLEDPEVASKIQSLYQRTRLSIQGPKAQKDASRLERFKDLEDSAIYDRAAHEEWLTHLPREKQEAYFEFMFLMRSLQKVISEYGEFLAEDGSEGFDMGIIDEIFERVDSLDLREEELKDEQMQFLAVYYAKIRKYKIKARESNAKYGREDFEKLTATLIKVFRSLSDAEEEKKSPIDEGLKDLEEIHQDIIDGDGSIGLEELERIEKCFQKISVLRMVIPHDSTVVDRLYGEKLDPQELDITKRRICNAVTDESTTPEQTKAKGDFLQGPDTEKLFPVSKQGEEILAEALTVDLLQYIPKDMPRNLRVEFRNVLKRVMIELNKVILHLNIVKEINGYDVGSHKNLQRTLLHGIREDLNRIKGLLRTHSEDTVEVELEPASDEIETITYEVEVKQSEAIRGENEKKSPIDILRDKKEEAGFMLSLTVKELIGKLDGLLSTIDQHENDYHPGREIKHFCETASNRFRRCAQVTGGIFHNDPELTEMFPEVEDDIREAVRLRKDFYAFYRELKPLAKDIEGRAKEFPDEIEIEDEGHKIADRIVRNHKKGEFIGAVGKFYQVMEDYEDLISRMRPGDRELIVDKQMKIDQFLSASAEDRVAMDKMAQEIHTLMLPLEQIATYEINKRELLQHEDKKHMEDAMENLFMSKLGINNAEVSREALLKIITRLSDANNSLKEAFYRNPKLIIKIQKRLNQISENLLSLLVASLEPLMTDQEKKDDKNRKISIDEETRQQILSFLSVAEDRLAITHDLL